MNSIADFFAWVTKERRIALKGDVPGHEFHGNQYSDGGGSSSGGESKSGSYDLTTADYSGKHQIIFKKEGKEIGEITTQKRPDGNLEVGNVLVWPKYQRQGHATEFYKEAFKFANSIGKKLYISDDRTDQAKSLHKTFERNGNLKSDGQIVF